VGKSFEQSFVGYNKNQVDNYITEIQEKYRLELKNIDEEIEKVSKQYTQLKETINELTKQYDIIASTTIKLDDVKMIVDNYEVLIMEDVNIKLSRMNKYYEDRNNNLYTDIRKIETEIEKYEKVYKELIANVGISLSNNKGAVDISSFEINNKCQIDLQNDVNVNYNGGVKDNLLGKPLIDDILDEQGNRIYHTGQIVNDEMVSSLKESGEIFKLISSI